MKSQKIFDESEIGGRVCISSINWLQIPKPQIPVVDKKSTKNRYMLECLKNGPWD